MDTNNTEGVTTSNLKLGEHKSSHPSCLTMSSNHVVAIGGENSNVSAVPIPINKESSNKK
jgi:hypothetical protein